MSERVESAVVVEPVRGLALLGQRDFALLFGARAISVFGNALGPLALTFAVLGLPGTTPVSLSVVFAAVAVPRIVFMLFGGVIGDRWPRQRVLVVAELLGGGAYAGMAALVLTSTANVALLAFFGTLAGVAAALLLPSLTGLVAEVVPAPSRQSANALLRLGTNTATVAGFMVGGATIALFHVGWALAVDSATFVASAAMLAALRLPPTVLRGRSSLLRDLRHGWDEFVRRQWLWTMVVAAAFINAGVGVTLGLAGPVLAHERLGGAAAWSAVLAGYAVGMLVGVVVAMRIRVVRPLVAAAVTASALALPALTLAAGAPLPVVVIAAMIAGIAFDVFGVLWETTFQQEVPEAALSRVSAYEWLGAVALAPVAMLVAAGPISAYGASPVLLAVAVVIAAASIAPLLSPEVRHYERRRDA